MIPQISWGRPISRVTQRKSWARWRGLAQARVSFFFAQFLFLISRPHPQISRNFREISDTSRRQLRLAGWPLRGLSHCNSWRPPISPPLLEPIRPTDAEQSRGGTQGTRPARTCAASWDTAPLDRFRTSTAPLQLHPSSFLLWGEKGIRVAKKR